VADIPDRDQPIRDGINSLLRTERENAHTLLGIARTELARGNRRRVRDLAGKIRQAHSEMLRCIARGRDLGLDTRGFESQAARIGEALNEIEAAAAERT
jgi:C4-dicarboxylate-specific signal transduction histidine kinase